MFFGRLRGRLYLEWIKCMIMITLNEKGPTLQQARMILHDGRNWREGVMST